MTEQPAGANQKSILTSSFVSGCFCSDFLPAATALQSAQGCLPSKVFSNASVTEQVRIFLENIPTHATDCSKAQCPPIDRIRAITTKHLPSRFLTPRAIEATSAGKSIPNYCSLWMISLGCSI